MLKDNLESIRNKISVAAKSSGREPGHVQLLAVTKKVSPDRIREAYFCGLRNFAENYIQEAMLKQAGLADLPGIEWHFIGNIQSNKVKLMIGRFALIHSVDRLKIIKEISARAADQAQNILIEVNLAGENSKGGCVPEELPELLNQAQTLPKICVKGLMFMPPIKSSHDELKVYYAKARELREQMLKRISAPHSLDELSMGTSHDFEIAVQFGATIVRLGTVLFGRRN